MFGRRYAVLEFVFRRAGDLLSLGNVVSMGSLWHDTLGRPTPERTPFGTEPADHRRWDVVIVGAGFTGLWTARSLLDADATRSVLLLDANTVGFGASGRNGGWASALFPRSTPDLRALYGDAAALAMRAAMRDTVDGIGRAVAADGIECDYAKGGTITVATTPQQVERIQHHAEPDDPWLDTDAAMARLATSTSFGASYTPHCAAIHPAKLAVGLADAVEARGARIAEHSRVRQILPHRVVLDDGQRIDADLIVRATEGFTPALRGHRRAIVPVYSLMIATEPLAESVWDEIGLRERETFADGRRLTIYGQRTADGRLAFGGRGAPYHFGSRIAPSFDTHDGVFAKLEHTLRTLLPQIGDVPITHRWGGALGVPRDWHASVGYDPASGLAWAGGYVGDGVSTTNLAGRTLSDLVTGADTELVRLPWVGHRSPNWEPEPLRYLGINAARALTEYTDAAETNHRAGVPALDWAIDRLTGR